MNKSYMIIFCLQKIVTEGVRRGREGVTLLLLSWLGIVCVLEKKNHRLTGGFVFATSGRPPLFAVSFHRLPGCGYSWNGA